MSLDSAKAPSTTIDLRESTLALLHLRAPLAERVHHPAASDGTAIDQDRLLVVHAVSALIDELRSMNERDDPPRRAVRMRAVRALLTSLGYDDPFGRELEAGGLTTKRMLLQTMGQAVADCFGGGPSETEIRALFVSVRETLRSDASAEGHPAAHKLAARFLGLISEYRAYKLVVPVIPPDAEKRAVKGIVKYAETLEGSGEKGIETTKLCAYLLWGLGALSVQQRSEFFARLEL